MRLDATRLCLRSWEECDRIPFAAMNADSRVMEFLGKPLTRDKSDEAIQKQINLMDQGQPAFWAVERLIDSKFMGFIGVKAVTFEADFTPCHEIGWRLAPEFWGQGYATEGAKKALSFAFQKWNLSEIHSFTVHKNKASQAVMRKIGMKRVEGGDFDHPSLSKSDPLLGHVLYKIGRDHVQLSSG